MKKLKELLEGFLELGQFAPEIIALVIIIAMFQFVPVWVSLLVMFTLTFFAVAIILAGDDDDDAVG